MKQCLSTQVDDTLMYDKALHKPGKPCAKLKKPVRKDTTCCMIPFIEKPRLGKSTDRKSISGLPRAGGVEGRMESD